MLLLCLKNIVAQRAGSGRIDDKIDCSLVEAEARVGTKGQPMSEVVEVLQLTDCMLPFEQQQAYSGSIELDADIERQLKEYVTLIANMYGPSSSTPYHNYEHASYVMMTTGTMQRLFPKALRSTRFCEILSSSLQFSSSLLFMMWTLVLMNGLQTILGLWQCTADKAWCSKMQSIKNGRHFWTLA